MQVELVNQLTDKMHAYAIFLQRYPKSGWSNWYAGQKLNIKISDNNTISFSNGELGKFSGLAEITFSNVRPYKVTYSKLDKPVLTNTKQVDVSSTIIDNTSSDIDIDRTYTYEITTGTTVDTDIGAEASLSISQAIHYGGGVVSGTTDIAATISSSYRRASGESESTTRTVTTDFTVPAGKKADINITQSVSDFSQKSHYTCAIEHNVELFSGSLFQSAYNFKFDSNKDAIDVLTGKGEYTDDERLKVFQTKPIDYILQEQLSYPINLNLTETVKYHNASTGNVTVKETDT